MSGNRSLDEFGADAGADADQAEAATADASDEAAPPSADPAAADDPIEPIAETFAWSASGAACGACGATVTTRWRHGDQLVCEDCKAW